MMEIRGMRAGELDEMIDLQCRIFRPDGHERYRHYIRGDSSYELDQTRVVVVDGRIVATLRVWARILRVGSCPVPMGGIGGVGTDPGHRGKGYASAMLEDAVDYLRKSGYDISVLFTEVPAVFYRRVGWESVPQAAFRLFRRRSAHPEPDGWQVDAFDEARDLEQAVTLYDACNARQSGSLVRPRAHWDTAPARIRSLLPTVVARRGDHLGGYLNFDLNENGADVLEVAYDRDEPTVLRDLAHHLLGVCETRGISEIRGDLPHWHPLVDLLVRGSAADLHLAGCTSMMVRAVNLASLLRRALPELQARLDALGQSLRPVAARLSLNGQRCTVRLDQTGHLRVEEADVAAETLDLPGEIFWRALFGASAWAQLEPALQARGIPISPELSRLFGVLFPQQDVIYWGSDHY